MKKIHLLKKKLGHGKQVKGRRTDMSASIQEAYEASKAANPELYEMIARPSRTNGARRTAVNAAIDYLMKNPQDNFIKIFDRLDAIVPKSLFEGQRAAFRTAAETHNNWYQLVMKVMELNPEVLGPLMKCFLTEGNILAWPQQEENREILKCNIPWAVLLDPTSACNLHCTGCWAGEYGHALNLSYEDIDSIINQANELGTHVFIYTGGEPLVRKKDVIRLCEAHPDSAFLSFTNATLIDEQFCQDMVRVKNFVPAISVEGIGEATDGRRGEGTFARIDAAMTLLREYRLPFGVSCCHTKDNAEAIASEEFFDWLIDKGALFAWIFTFMPVGADSTNDLMPTVEQREQLYHFVREMRNIKPLFTLDFQNDGEFVGGCVAGGRRYLHINAKGDVDPCVFAHYSNSNLYEVSLLDALRSPLFMQYYDNMPFDGDNLLRPCPIYENSGKLAEMVKAAGAHSTDLTAEEDVDDLMAKTAQRAVEWKPVAERLWNDPDDPRAWWRDRVYIGMADSDISKFEKRGAIGETDLAERKSRYKRLAR